MSSIGAKVQSWELSREQWCWYELRPAFVEAQYLACVNYNYEERDSKLVDGLSSIPQENKDVYRSPYCQFVLKMISFRDYFALYYCFAQRYFSAVQHTPLPSHVALLLYQRRNMSIQRREWLTNGIYDYLYFKYQSFFWNNDYCKLIYWEKPKMEAI